MSLFVRRNPNEPQDEKLRLSKERNRFKSVVWEPYDKKQRKYMEIGILVSHALVVFTFHIRTAGYSI